MAVKVIICFCCVLCAIPFLMLSYIGKISKEALMFFAGDITLKEKVKDILSYNRAMSKLYLASGFAFLVSGLFCFISLKMSIAFLIIDCTIGLYLVYLIYQKILRKYS